MIRLYDNDSEIEVSNETDLDELLSVMDEIDEFYNNRKEIPAEFISTHRNTLYFSILYVIENENKEAIKIIKDGIKFWEKFTDEQQAVLISSLSMKFANAKIMDEYIEEWLESIAKIQKRYQ